MHPIVALSRPLRSFQEMRKYIPVSEWLVAGEVLAHLELCCSALELGSALIRAFLTRTSGCVFTCTLVCFPSLGVSRGVVFVFFFVFVFVFFATSNSLKLQKLFESNSFKHLGAKSKSQKKVSERRDSVSVSSVQDCCL